MKIAKEFRWEMGHRLPFHAGKCKNLHGHSYKMLLELEGDTDTNGMVMDYYDVKSAVNPIVEELDHSFFVCKSDTELINALTSLNSKMTLSDYHSTAENICHYFLERIKASGLPKNIKKIKVRIFETEESYAEDELALK
jgi:6-pyruvoyltetrahydropterin/6-carboxytetrahydropterin synthase